MSKQTAEAEMSIRKHEIVEQAVVALLDVGVVLHENELECRLCGQLNSHSDECPVPVLEHWLNLR